MSETTDPTCVCGRKLSQHLYSTDPGLRGFPPHCDRNRLSMFTPAPSPSQPVSDDMVMTLALQLGISPNTLQSAVTALGKLGYQMVPATPTPRGTDA